MSLPLFTAAMFLVGTPGEMPQTPAPVTIPQEAPAASTDTTPSATPPESDIVVTARQRDTPGDPLEEINAKSFNVTQAVDGAIVAPAARAYRTILPGPVRDGVGNFLSHLREPAVFLNFLLQLKIGKAAETLGRFVVNSTIGLAGIVDVAKLRPVNLPHRRNGFADTMGFYGVKHGAFLFLPLIGPTTVRDLIGDTLDRLLLPTLVGKPFNQTKVTLPLAVLSALDYRSEFDDRLQQIREQSDPYTAVREFYLYRRQAEIDGLRGGTPKAVLPAADLVPARTTAPGPAPVEP